MSRRGQGLVEFALAFLLLIFLVMAIADFGRILLIYAELAGGVREALRYAVANAPSGAMKQDQWNAFCYGAMLDRMKGTLVLSPKNALIPQQTYFVYFEPFRYDTSQFDPPVLCPPTGKNFVLKREDRVVVEVRVQTTPVTPLIQALLPKVQIQYRSGRTLFPPDGVYFGPSQMPGQ